MFEWLKRLFNIGVAEANAALDKIEDPVKMTRQGITDLKTDLQKSMQALAEVKAAAIRSKKDLEQAKSNSLSYEQKAVALLQRAQSGQLDAAEADRLATIALNKKDQIDQGINGLANNTQMLEGEVAKMEQNVQRLRTQIEKWESEFKTLEARSKVSNATKKLNEQLAQIDSSGTVARLERMKEKVYQQEALAESYAQMANANVSEDEEIEKALGSGARGSAALNAPPSEALLKLKAKMSAGSGDASQSASNSATPPPAADAPSNEGISELEKLKQQLRDE